MKSTERYDARLRLPAIAPLHAQQHTIQALAITQSQQNEKLDHHGGLPHAAHDKLDRSIIMLETTPR